MDAVLNPLPNFSPANESPEAASNDKSDGDEALLRQLRPGPFRSMPTPPGEPLHGPAHPFHSVPPFEIAEDRLPRRLVQMTVLYAAPTSSGAGHHSIRRSCQGRQPPEAFWVNGFMQSALWAGAIKRQRRPALHQSGVPPPHRFFVPFLCCRGMRFVIYSGRDSSKKPASSPGLFT